VKLNLRYFAQLRQHLTVAVLNEKRFDVSHNQVHVIAVRLIVGFLELD
jgi:hypothetical protein